MPAGDARPRAEDLDGPHRGLARPTRSAFPTRRAVAGGIPGPAARPAPLPPTPSTPLVAVLGGQTAGGLFSKGVDSTTVVRVATFAASRIWRNRSSSPTGEATLTRRMYDSSPATE